MRNINLRQLEAFRAVMMTRSITRASELLFVSQPAVTRLIKDLESSAGFPLFQRIKKRLNPTPEAHAFYEEVERSFAGLNKINLAAREIRDFRSGSLSIAALPALGLSYLPEFISRFADGKPDISLSLNIRASQKVSEMVAAQKADIGFCESIDFSDGIESELLLKVNLVCILPKGHPLASKEQIEATDLDGETCIGAGNSQLTYSDLDRYFEEKGVKRKVRIDTQLNATVADFVVAGAGIGIIDPVTAAHYSHRGIIVKPFNPSIVYQYYVIFPENRPKSRLTDQFVDMIRQDLQRFAAAETV